MTKAINEVPVERLFEVFDVDFEQGLLFWKNPTGKRVGAGSIAGSKDSHGYLRVRLDHKRFKIHRVIWAMKYGAWPVNQIDHINRDPSDNKISNLREATPSQNGMNKLKSKKGSKWGVKGIYFDKQRQKFRAEIYINGKKRFLGYFPTIEKASQSYIAASQQYCGEYSPFSN